MYFQYGLQEINHLKKQDEKLKVVIEQIGFINREVIPDLFTALISSILSQQISSKAFSTIWNRFNDKFAPLSPSNIGKCEIEDIQKIGTSFRKAQYIYELALNIVNKNLDLDLISKLDDEEIIKELIKIKGIGRWTAQMLLIFSLQRPNVISYDDLAIIRGLKIIYGEEHISKEKFKEFENRFSPYNSVASLYIWAVAGDALKKKNLD